MASKKCLFLWQLSIILILVLVSAVSSRNLWGAPNHQTAGEFYYFTQINGNLTKIYIKIYYLLYFFSYRQEDLAGA